MAEPYELKISEVAGVKPPVSAIPEHTLGANIKDKRLFTNHEGEIIEFGDAGAYTVLTGGGVLEPNVWTYIDDSETYTLPPLTTENEHRIVRIRVSETNVPVINANGGDTILFKGVTDTSVTIYAECVIEFMSVDGVWYLIEYAINGEGGGSGGTTNRVRLATSENTQVNVEAIQGDVTIRTDLRRVFHHNGGNVREIASWTIEPLYISTVSGQSPDNAGNIALTKEHVGLENVGNFSISDDVNNDSSDSYASSKAVKSVNDKVVALETGASDKLDVTAMTDHLNDPNAHGITAESLGLGNANGDISNLQATVLTLATKTTTDSLRTDTDANTAIITGLASDVDDHVTDGDNPHGVTKAQVGLANVGNYGISDSITSTNSGQYASSKAVRDVYQDVLANAAAIANLASSSALTDHEEDIANPHAVTKQQVGLGVVENFPVSSSYNLNSVVTYATSKAVRDVYQYAYAQVTSLGTSKADDADLQAHVTDTANPHGVTKSQIGLGSVRDSAGTSSVSSASTTTYALAAGVKTAYDRAVSGETDARAYTDTKIAELLGGAPVEALDTIVELGAALSANGDAIATINASIATKATSASVTALDTRLSTAESDIASLETDKADLTTLSAHTGSTSNPHSVTKAQVGLGSVVNQGKTDSLTSNSSALYSTAKAAYNLNLAVIAAQSTADAAATSAELTTHEGNTSNPHGVTKAQVGLGSVGNYGKSDSVSLNSSTTYATSKAVKTAYDLANTVNSALSGYATLSGLSSHAGDSSNPHSVTKSQVGLGNVQNYGKSDSVSLNSSTTYATSKAVKLAYDKAIEAVNAGGYQREEVGLTGTAGNWYRIATGTDNLTGTFIITNKTSSQHGSVHFLAGITFNIAANITVLHATGYGTNQKSGAVTQVRIVSLTTDDTYGMKAIEVYVANNVTAANCVISLEPEPGNYNDNWALITPVVSANVVATKTTFNISTAQMGSSTRMSSNGGLVYSTTNKPSKSDVGLGNVGNYGRSSSVTSTSTTTYATSAAVKAAYDAAIVAQGESANALKLGGHSETTASTANTIVTRDGNADIHIRSIHTTLANVTTCGTGVGFAFRNNNSSDNIQRHVTLAGLKAVLGVTNVMSVGDTASNSLKLNNVEAQYIPKMETLRLTQPGGATYNSSASGTTGALCVVLPSMGNNTMLSFVLRVFTYQDHGSFDVVISLYSTTATTRCSAHAGSQIPAWAANMPVRFGNNGSKNTITLGNTTQAWAYCKAAVTDVLYGHSGGSLANWNDGWDITMLSALPSTTTATRYLRREYNSDNKPSKSDVGLGNVGNYGKSDSVTSTSSTVYATSKAVKTAYDAAIVAQGQSDNALKLGGHSETTAATANTIAARDGSGDLRARLFRSNYAAASSIGTSTHICFRNSTTDDYMRFVTFAAFKTALAIPANTWRSISDSVTSTSTSVSASSSAVKTAYDKANSAMHSGETHNTITLTNWVRTSGNTGVYFSTHGGGVYMTDSTYVRTYNNKSLYVANQILATGNITAYYSDERLKDIIGRIEGGREIVRRWNPIRYTANALAAKLAGYDTERVEVGLGANTVGKTAPELLAPAPFDVAVDEDGNNYSKSGENYKTLDYERSTAYLTAALQDEMDLTDALREKVANQDEELKSQAERLRKLEAVVAGLI